MNLQAPVSLLVVACVALGAPSLNGAFQAPPKKQAAAKSEAAAKPQTSSTRFILKGTLVKEDGTPVEGGHCLIGKDDPAGFRWEVGPDGLLANPRAKSDKHGRFQFDADRSFLPKNRRILVSCNTPWNLNSAPLRGEDGALVVIEIHPQAKVIDLDKITGKIIVK